MTDASAIPANDSWREDPTVLWFAAALGVGAVVLGRFELLGLLALTPLLRAAMRSHGIAVVAVVMVIYTNAAVVATKFHGVPKIVAMLAPAPLLFVLFHHLVRKKRALVLTPTLPWITLFLFLQTLSFLLARNPRLAWPTMEISLLEGLFLYLLLTNAIRGKRMLHIVGWSLAACGAFLGGLSFLQWSTDTYHLSYGGFAQVSDGLGIGVETARGTRHQPRLCGPIGEQNRYAQILAMLIPLIYCYLLAESRRGRRWLLLAALGLTAAGCLLTYSRGAVLALGLVGAAMTVLGFVRPRHAVLVGVLGCVLVAISPSMQKRILSIRRAVGVFDRFGSESEQPDGAVKGRATAMLAAARVFADHPVLGVGPGQFNEHARAYSREGGLRAFEQDREAHCLYLELAAENGALGLVVFLLMVGVSLRQLCRVRRRYLQSGRRDEALRVSGYVFAIIVYLATALFLHFSYARYFWLLLALADSTAQASSPQRQVPAEEDA